jgi:hypothetical protein
MSLQVTRAHGELASCAEFDEALYVRNWAAASPAAAAAAAAASPAAATPAPDAGAAATAAAPAGAAAPPLSGAMAECLRVLRAHHGSSCALAPAPQTPSVAASPATMTPSGSCGSYGSDLGPPSWASSLVEGSP